MLNPSAIRVSHGANDSYFEIVGKSVALVRRSLRTAFNIPNDAQAHINGIKVEEDHRLLPGAHLEFVMKDGLKGTLDPDERAIFENLVHAVSQVARDVEFLKAAFVHGDSTHPLSPLERAIVKAIGTSEIKGESIARRMGRDLNSNLRSTLSGLIKRGVLGKGRKGYFVRNS